MLDRDEIAMQRVIDFMNENLGEPITVADLARVASFSKFHFSRVFSELPAGRPAGSSPPSASRRPSACCCPPR